MKLAIMQPYFLPYLGYWQLANAVDAFVIYDEIKYTKKGWINRNRMLMNGSDAYITLPLKKDSNSLFVCQRELGADFFKKDGPSLKRKVGGAYRRAPFYEDGMDYLTLCLDHADSNLFGFLKHSIGVTLKLLGIETPVVVSSSLDYDANLRGQDRVIAICKSLGCSEYINPPGGKELYESDSFEKQNMALRFLKPEIRPYQQGNQSGFVEHLSIIDPVMNLGIEATTAKLSEYSIE